MKTTFLHLVDQASNDIAVWFYCRDEQCIRVHVFGVTGWFDGTSGRTVIDDFGNLARVD